MKGIIMKKFTDNLKRQIEENPIVALAVAAAVITATSKLLDANTQRSYAKTHALEVQRRILNAK
jgi:hypothetical protein